MRIWFDTEFWDTGTQIHLISIGMVREDNTEFYAEFFDMEAVKQMTPWLAEHVAPFLHGGVSVWDRDAAAGAIIKFAGVQPEFWAYVADYDWVGLSQLYGTLVNRPATWPWTALDTFQLPDFRKYAVKAKMPHNALSDAQALKASHLAYEGARK